MENRTLTEQGKEVPISKILPSMADILKLRQAPCASNNTAFTFIVEHLAGAVIGQQKWKTARCYVPLSNAMSVSDEAFMLLVLENQYELWMDAESTRVGRGRYTDNVPNKKYCGWSNEGMRHFNILLAKVRNNQNKQYSKEVEDATTRTLAERYQTLMAVRGRNSRKRWRHHVPDSDDEANQEEDDDSIYAEDELILLANATATAMV
jgi:hypothetical protein